MQGAPKFGKVELVVKQGDNTNLYEYDDCGMVITGNYIIIVIDEKNDIESTNTSTGKIYNIADVVEYRTHAQ